MTTVLPDGRRLHRYQTPDGEQWVCAAPDHTRFCRRCQLVDVTLAWQLIGLQIGQLELAGMEPDGTLRFRLP